MGSLLINRPPSTLANGSRCESPLHKDSREDVRRQTVHAVNYVREIVVSEMPLTVAGSHLMESARFSLATHLAS